MSETLDKLREELNNLQALEKAAQDRYRVAAELERQERMAASDEFVMKAPVEAFYAPKDRSMDTRPYILPFGNDYPMFNPWSSESCLNHEFGQSWLAGMTALICTRIDVERNGPSRLIWTSGHVVTPEVPDYVSRDPGRDLIGARFHARHDQTNAKLGDYEIVGLAFYGADGLPLRMVGEVPNKGFRESTYK